MGGLAGVGSGRAGQVKGSRILQIVQMRVMCCVLLLILAFGSSFGRARIRPSSYPVQNLAAGPAESIACRKIGEWRPPRACPSVLAAAGIPTSSLGCSFILEMREAFIG